MSAAPNQNIDFLFQRPRSDSTAPGDTGLDQGFARNDTASEDAAITGRLDRIAPRPAQFGGIATDGQVRFTPRSAMDVGLGAPAATADPSRLSEEQRNFFRNRLPGETLSQFNARMAPARQREAEVQRFQQQQQAQAQLAEQQRQDENRRFAVEQMLRMQELRDKRSEGEESRAIAQSQQQSQSEQARLEAAIRLMEVLGQGQQEPRVSPDTIVRGLMGRDDLTPQRAAELFNVFAGSAGIDPLNVGAVASPATKPGLNELQGSPATTALPNSDEAAEAKDDAAIDAMSNGRPIDKRQPRIPRTQPNLK